LSTHKQPLILISFGIDPSTNQMRTLKFHKAAATLKYRPNWAYSLANEKEGNNLDPEGIRIAFSLLSMVIR